MAYFTQDDVNGGTKKWQRALQVTTQSGKLQLSLSDRELAFYVMHEQSR